MSEFYVIANEIIQWIALILILWGVKHISSAVVQLQMITGRSINKEVEQNMKRIHETETFQ